jgi:hypothetical protein
MNHLNDVALAATELTGEDLDRVAGGLNFWKAIFIAGTSSAPGGTGTDPGPTGTNAQAWVISVS